MSTRVSIEFTQLVVTSFNGENYELWIKKIKAYLVVLELWDVVSNGYIEDETRRNELGELKKNDAKAIFVFNQSVSDEIYPRISYAQTAHEAWNIFKTEFHEEEKVAMVKLQTFRRSLKNLI